jgi:hypothetical protein
MRKAEALAYPEHHPRSLVERRASACEIPGIELFRFDFPGVLACFLALLCLLIPLRAKREASLRVAVTLFLCGKRRGAGISSFDLSTTASDSEQGESNETNERKTVHVLPFFRKIMQDSAVALENLRN